MSGGAAVPCLVTGAAMLAVPGLALAGSVASLAVVVPLAVGAVAVVLAVGRPRGLGAPALAVLCAALALIPGAPDPLAAGACGLAALAFLLAAKLHRQAVTGPAGPDLAGWLAAHRPMVVGAAVTTPAALAAAVLPPAWSVPVGVALAALAAAAFRAA